MSVGPLKLGGHPVPIFKSRTLRAGSATNQVNHHLNSIRVTILNPTAPNFEQLHKISR